MLWYQGDGTPSSKPLRVCHMCGDRIKSQAICPSCGHARCRRSSPIVTEDPAQQPPAVSNDIRPRTSEPQPTQAAAPPPVREKPALGSDRVEESSKNEEVKRVTKSGSVRNNPFVIADQIAKAKLAEPQTSTHIVHAATSPYLWKSLSAIEDRYGRTMHSKTVENPANDRPGKLSLYNKSYGESRNTSLPKVLRSYPHSSGNSSNSRETGLSERESELESHNTPILRSTQRGNETKKLDDSGTPRVSSAPSSPSVGTEVSPVIRQVKVLGREPTTGTLDQVLEVDMEGGGGKDSGHSIPRVRVSSPPSWLKNPSTQPGSIQGFLRHIDDTATGTDTAQDPHSATRQQLLHRKPEVEDFHYHLSHHQPRALYPSEPTIPTARHNGKQDGFSEATEKPTNSPCKTVGSTTSPGHGIATRRTTEGTNTTTGSGVTAAITNARAMLRKRDNALPPLDDHQHDHLPHTRQWLDDIQHRHQNHYQHAENEEEVDDVGIRGLTIVLHLRGKDDLVISTDLTREVGPMSDGWVRVRVEERGEEDV